MEFVLMDLLPQLMGGRAATARAGAPGAAPGGGAAAAGGVGHVYGGGMPPMAWIQREQRAAGSESIAPAADPVSVAAELRQRGNRALGEGNMALALELYTEAVESSPNDELAYTNRSLVNFKLARFEASAADARQAIRLRPTFYKGHFRLATALVALQEWDAALESFRTALELAPTPAERAEIQIAITKCESKRARAPVPVTPLAKKVATPLDPEGTFKEADVLDRSAGGAAVSLPDLLKALGVNTQAPVTFQASDAPPGLGAPLDAIAARVQCVLEGRDRLQPNLGEPVEVAQSVHFLNRLDKSLAVKKLLGMSDPGVVSAAAESAQAAQEALRTASEGQSRLEYQRCLSKRDESYAELTRAVENAVRASEALKQIAAEGPPQPLPVPAIMPPETAGDAPHPAPLTKPPGDQLSRDEVVTLLHELEQAQARIAQRIATAMKRTDATAMAFAEALTNEIKEQTELRALSDGCARIRRRLQEEYVAFKEFQLASASAASQGGAAAPPLVTDQQLQGLASFEPRLKRLRTDVIAFRSGGRRGQELLEEEAHLEHERLRQERYRIQLQADIEWLAIKEEDDAHRVSRLQDALQCTQQRIRRTVERQQAVHRELIALINGDHPELAWSASAGGSKVLKWLKGSGLWVNAAFSDFTILKTLSSTVNSKVYHARGRRGDEVALKEVTIDGEGQRRAFQNEINAMVASSTHPNIVKLHGVFFDGPFAYIVMPYFKVGSLKAYLQSFGQAPQRQQPQGGGGNTTAATTTATDDNDSDGNQGEGARREGDGDGAETRPPPPQGIPLFKLQEMLRQLVSGVAYLHERGVVHADLKPSNILLCDDLTPIITDFGVAKDIGKLGEKDMTQTGTVGGTFDFQAPEVQLGSRHATTKGDIWSLAMTLFAVAAANATIRGESSKAPTLPVLLPDADLITVSAEAVGSDRLAELLTSMLHKDPTKRPSAHEVLMHPYFTVSLAEDLVTNKHLVESNQKMEAFRNYIHALRRGLRQPLLISVVRSQMVESISSIFTTLQEGDLLSPLFVVFRGEDGVDEGALTTEMFRLFFEQLVTKHRMLVAAGQRDSDSETPPSSHSQHISPNAEYLPSADPRIPSQRFNVLGRVLLKCVVEGRNVPFTLNSAVFKYILGVPVDMRDLEGYDAALAQSLKRLLILSEEDLVAAGLDFSEMPARFIAAWCDSHTSSPSSQSGPFIPMPNGGAITRDTIVTPDNVRAFVQMRCEYELIGRREEPLKALREGFRMCEALLPHLHLLSVPELMMQVCGQQHISPSAVIEALQFVEFPAASRTPAHLKEVIQGLSQNNLRRFLMLCTPHVVMPAGGLPPIKVQRVADLQRLPVGHGCVSQLDLPDYNDKQVLTEKLATALSHVNDGFLVA